jgi:hypothetical protein
MKAIRPVINRKHQSSQSAVLLFLLSKNKEINKNKYLCNLIILSILNYLDSLKLVYLTSYKGSDFD